MQPDGSIAVKIKGIYAKYLGHMYELSISNGSDTYKVRYSPMTYAYNKSNTGGNSLKNMMKALYNYYNISEKFFD